MSVPTAPPRETTIDYKTMVLRADPAIKQRPQAEYEFSNGRTFFDKPVDPNSAWSNGQ